VEVIARPGLPVVNGLVRDTAARHRSLECLPRLPLRQPDNPVTLMFQPWADLEEAGHAGQGLAIAIIEA
jgi:hypothetical protein